MSYPWQWDQLITCVRVLSSFPKMTRCYSNVAGTRSSGLNMVDEKTIPNLWDEVAPYVTGDVSWTRYDRAIRLLPNSPDSPVLDLGSGPGRLLSLLERSVGGRIVGVDISFQALAGSRRRFGISADLAVGESGNLPFVGNSFRTVFCTDALEHFPTPEQGLREMARILSPNGWLIVSTPGQLARAASALGIYRSFQPIDTPVPYSTITSTLTDAGLAIKKRRLYPPSLAHLVYSKIVGRANKKEWLSRRSRDLEEDSLQRGLKSPLVKLAKVLDIFLGVPFWWVLNVMPGFLGQYGSQDIIVVAVKEGEQKDQHQPSTGKG